MSNIRIDNPQRLLALAEQMNGFQNAFGKFIENMRNAVKTTMDQLTRLKITIQNKINEVDNEISSLYNERSSYSWPEDKEAIWDIDDQIKSAKVQKYLYIEHKKKIDQIYKDIDYQYKHKVKPKEDSLSNAISQYPRGIEALNMMGVLMKKYLIFSSELVKTNKFDKNSAPNKSSDEMGSNFGNQGISNKFSVELKMDNILANISLGEIQKRYVSNREKSKITPKDRKLALAMNKFHHNGLLIDEITGEVLVEPIKNIPGGIKPPYNQAELDHIIPVNKLGYGNPPNITVMARWLNRIKSNMSSEDFSEFIKEMYKWEEANDIKIKDIDIVERKAIVNQIIKSFKNKT